MYFNIFKIPSVGLRLFNVYGPGQNPHSPYSAVIPIFINRMKRNLKIIINGGYQTRDFVYIDDIIKVMFLSMKKLQRQKSYHVMNVGTGKSHSLMDLVNLIEKKVKKKVNYKIKRIHNKELFITKANKINFILWSYKLYSDLRINYEKVKK